MGACKYGDPLCPCQDGDPCHYEGENPWPVPASGQASCGHAETGRIAAEMATQMRPFRVNHPGAADRGLA